MSTVALPVSRPLRRPARLLGWGMLLGLLLLVLLAAISSGPSTCPAPASSSGTSAGLASTGSGEKAIPSDVAQVYGEVAAQSGVPAPVLAAVGYIETRHGRDRSTSSAGAQGPMQFLPSTWSSLGCTGSIQELRPAVVCAARYLTMLAREPGASRSGVDRWQYAACRYNGGCARGISAEAGYGSTGEVAGRLAAEYGYTAGAPVPTLAGVAGATSSDCGDQSAASGPVGDVVAAAAPFLGKSWSQSKAAGLDPLGWADGTPWCMILVQGLLKRLGIERPDPRNAHSSAPYNWTQRGWGILVHGPGRPASPSVELQPGDLVMYGPPGAGSAHINMVETVDQRGAVTVGGNQSCANGNGVCRRGPVRLTGSRGALRWASFDRRPIWAIVRPPAPKGRAA